MMGFSWADMTPLVEADTPVRFFVSGTPGELKPFSENEMLPGSLPEHLFCGPTALVISMGPRVEVEGMLITTVFVPPLQSLKTAVKVPVTTYRTPEHCPPGMVSSVGLGPE
jgi:hypothetical protein